MISLKSLLTESSFIGTCVDILDGPSSPWADATELSQFIENSEPMDFLEGEKSIYGTGINKLIKLKLRRNPDVFKFAKNKNIMWMYDSEDDIHYFFKL